MYQSRLQQSNEELQGMLEDLRERETELEAAIDDKEALARKVEGIESSFHRARAEATEWKTLAER